jgi:hypothetical protein
MTKCNKCNEDIAELYFHCRRCNKNYCSKHRLPEDHECEELKKYKEQNKNRWTKAIKGRKQNEEIKESFVSFYKISKGSKLRKYNYLFWKFIKKYIIIITLIIILISFSIFIYIYSNLEKCDDGTLYNFCSFDKPLECSQGKLIENVSKCGCPIDYIIKNGKCIYKYEINPKIVTLPSMGNFVVYGGLNDYLSELDRSISYYSTPPTTKDFILRDLDNEIQKKYLDELVAKIKSRSDNLHEKANIAINLVQGIPYDLGAYNSNNVEGRYPYEVLYDMKGVCMEKSDLLAFLLRELDFGVAIFEFDSESHRAVGIKCKNGNYNSDYCFIESTDYYPVGQIPDEYVGGVDIRNAIPEIVVISEGESY